MNTQDNVVLPRAKLQKAAFFVLAATLMTLAMGCGPMIASVGMVGLTVIMLIGGIFVLIVMAFLMSLSQQGRLRRNSNGGTGDQWNSTNSGFISSSDSSSDVFITGSESGGSPHSHGSHGGHGEGHSGHGHGADEHSGDGHGGDGHGGDSGGDSGGSDAGGGGDGGGGGCGGGGD